MIRMIALACLVCPLALTSSGCKSDQHQAEMVLCADCGMEKGSAGCCDPNAAHCAKCGKIKGSPGCCK